MSDAEHPKPINWEEAITKGFGAEKPVGAVTFLQRKTTASNPVYLACDDQKTYVVKPMRNDANQGRMLFNDQIIARFGELIGAAVPRVGLVTIPKELIDANPDKQQAMGHCQPGVAHGSELLLNVTERVDQFQHVGDDDNKNRFVLLGVLHGWIGFSDRQFLYELSDPFRVSAVDHGHFFPAGPDWTVASLATAPPPAVAPDLATACGLAQDDLHAACAALARVPDPEIARIVAIPPDEWGVKINERVEVAKYISARRDVLSKAYAPQKEGVQ
jgi:hypothetical protein